MALTRDSIAGGLFEKIAAEGARLGLIRPLTEEERAASLRETLARRPDSGDVWVFAYGSLIWNPAIEVVETKQARLPGWRRRFCLETPVGRGTPEAPGLVLALEPGGACEGVIHRVAEGAAPHELPLLWRREMVADAYIPSWMAGETDAGEHTALAFVMDQTCARYTGPMDESDAARKIARAVGALGPNRDYLFSTAEHLRELDMPDAYLDRLVDLVENEKD